MSIYTLIEPGDAVLTSAVDSNFGSFATDLAVVTTANIEDSSIRTRHISTARGAWKEITLHTNPGTTAAPGGDTLVCPASGSTMTVTKTGQMVLVIAVAQFESTATSATGTCSADIRLSVGGVDVRTMTVKILGPEKLQIGTSYAFLATLDQTQIQLTIKGGGATFNVVNPEIQVIAVRG